MQKYRGKLVFGIVISLGLLSLGLANNMAGWEQRSHGIDELNIRALTIHPQNNKIIYAGTSQALYRSLDQGKSFQRIFYASGKSSGINFINVPVTQPSVINLATDHGLYQSQNEGKTWNQIYFSSDQLAARCLSVLETSDTIYLGTQRGLSYKRIDDPSWHHIDGGLLNQAIYQIVDDKDVLYITTSTHLFSVNKKTLDVERKFISGFANTDDSELEDADSSSNLSEIGFMRVAVANKNEKSYLIVASANGIYFSLNQGESWEELSTSDIPLEMLTSVIVLNFNPSCAEKMEPCLNLIIGTKRGAFLRKENGQWVSVYQGLETNVIQTLTKDAKDAVYAATDRGVFSLKGEKTLSSFINPELKEMGKNNLKETMDSTLTFENEPTVAQVHTWAIEYAEVHPDKIKEWRSLATKRAWFPKINLGLSTDLGLRKEDNVWGTYTSGGQQHNGPDTKTLTNNLGWDVSLSWDLSNLVWNSDQTSIDSRSKLMVELREDVLDQVTRLYFERRRTQLELIKNRTLDPDEKLEKQMRVAELTALLDAFTGGKFSREIKNNLLTATNG